jgi:hypothetical protein
MKAKYLAATIAIGAVLLLPSNKIKPILEESLEKIKSPPIKSPYNPTPKEDPNYFHDFGQRAILSPRDEIYDSRNEPALF